MKWFFSTNGKVSGPLNLAESNEFIKNNLDSYAWHPSYSHWLPVDCIDEFDTVKSIPKPPEDLPNDFFADFISEEQDIVDSFSRIESTLANTLTSLSELDIHSSIDMTKNLNEEVKVAVQNIEQQFAALQKNLAGVTKQQ